ncbi:MAG TPA: cupin [Sphingomicrobium sp.]|nr:cupin [Sphingomicrobium sp.]
MALHHLGPGEPAHLPSRLADGNGRAVALVKTDRFEAAQLVLAAGESIARHSVPGYATIQCLNGTVLLETDETIELKSGDWLYLDRAQEHSVQAVDDSSLLLTILFE